MGGELTKPEWGSKHICLSCGAKFYDMRRVPALCPGCNTKVKKSNSPTSQDATPTKPNSSAPVEAVTEDSDNEDTGDTHILEDTDEIEKDKDGIAEVLERGVANKD